MTKKTAFKPIIGSLDKLTEQERLDYVARLCEHLEVPADLGLVDLGWQDGGDGGRVLLPFVRKGAAEIIRNKHGISMDSVVPCNGEGYVAFVTGAHDPNGRKEFGVGAVSIKGLSATKVADAVMWASTRSSRRVTLQFVGGGVLDESELAETTRDINSASSLKEIAPPVQPQVQPNAAAGKDITESPKPEPSSSAAPTSQAVVQAEEPKKRPRGRPRKNPISLDSPNSAPTLPAQSNGLEQGEAEKRASALLVEGQRDTNSTPSTIPQRVEAAGATAFVSPSELSQAQLEPIVESTGTKCTEEQRDVFRKRRSEYVNDILPKAGFLQSEKLGSRNDKFKLFVQAMFPKSDIKHLTFEQWTHLFGYLDERVKIIGAEELVKLINKQIGEEGN